MAEEDKSESFHIRLDPQTTITPKLSASFESEPKKAESKEELTSIDVPFITNKGRKGGSPSASAIINALFKLLREESSS